jgi:hypothetical protein
MATEDFKRKLTAILSADVKGYSRLMGEDDELSRNIKAEWWTLRAITSSQNLPV